MALERRMLLKVEKVRRKGFTVISNDVLNNTALSWKAKESLRTYGHNLILGIL